MIKNGKNLFVLEAGTIHSWNSKPKGGSASGNMVQERGFLVLRDMSEPVLGESCTTSIKDFARRIIITTAWMKYN